MPDPDLLIRTAGELRLSNFLLWQISYAEIWVTDVLWPDFRGDDAAMAVWNTSDWTLRASYVADPHNINSLAISPDSRTIAASSRTKTSGVTCAP